MALDRYPTNPDYGSGAFRRRIRLIKGPNTSMAMLDDNHHAMWVRLQHDGVAITAIESEMVRVPADTCPGARVLLTELIGLPIGTTSEELFAGGRAKRNCTHLFDLAVMAQTFIPKPVGRQMFDIVLPDAAGLRTLRAYVDNRLVHEWVLDEEVIVAPPLLAGQELTHGFVGRVHASMSGIERDAALMMQKGVLVARGRRKIISDRPGRPLYDAVDMLGACFTYSEPRFSIAREIGDHVVDFSKAVLETPEPA